MSDTPNPVGRFLCKKHCSYFPFGSSGGPIGLCLEVQERLYSFLVECCMQLLCEYAREDIPKTDLPIQPEPPALSPSESAMNLFSVMTAEAPYRVPASLDLSRLLGASWQPNVPPQRITSGVSTRRSRILCRRAETPAILFRLGDSRPGHVLE
ncbi:hypothetical protein BO70DRAFT_395061 [Aspergillus heteromorphus CBS 117.55]|uniref:Uncharacterized protein n=1 Tax=Aspergillus heteromorphus CBS 117.55 TaxID=1448321 RepID=A0A317WLN2_9EURO|nr:uncharacterized protein BO70DRAFT_395061 [Aspergillus heteromorphus CBS 117.55]PWY85928.1 hypothetical protein BO70DRAFT_395061 [Aspergillus heteromorphus CBS 117.55]